MNIRKFSINRHAAALLGMLMLLGACSSTVKKDDVSVVDKRAVERWNLLITGKPDKAYNYLSPGYQKTKPRDIYAAEMGSRPVRWKKVQFISKDCNEGDVCHVLLLVDFTVKMNAGMPGEASSVDVIKEDWLNLGGHWYYLPSTLGKTTAK